MEPETDPKHYSPENQLGLPENRVWVDCPDVSEASGKHWFDCRLINGSWRFHIDIRQASPVPNGDVDVSIQPAERKVYKDTYLISCHDILLEIQENIAIQIHIGGSHLVNRVNINIKLHWVKKQVKKQGYERKNEDSGQNKWQKVMGM